MTRFPGKEQEPFAAPCWSADDIASYTGPVFRCTVTCWARDGSRQVSDHESPSMLALGRDLSCHRTDTTAVYSYGPHTEGERP